MLSFHVLTWIILSAECGIGDVVIENHTCVIDSKACSDITSLRVLDAGRVLFMDSCTLPGEIHLKGNSSQISFAENAHVEVVAYTIEGATHTFGTQSSLRSYSCRITNQSKVLVQNGVRLNCGTLLVDKTSLIDVIGSQENFRYSEGAVDENALQLSIRTDSLVLLGTLDLSNIVTGCVGTEKLCDQPFSVVIESKEIVLGSTTSFSSVATSSHNSHNVHISITSESTTISKWYLLFSDKAFRGLTGSFSYSTFGGLQQYTLLDPLQSHRILAVHSPTSTSNYRRLLSFSNAQHIDMVILRDTRERSSYTPTVKYYVTDESILPKLSAECNVEIYLLPSQDTRKLFQYDSLDSLLQNHQPRKLSEWEYTSMCSKDNELTKDAPSNSVNDLSVARSLAATPGQYLHRSRSSLSYLPFYFISSIIFNYPITDSTPLQLVPS